MNMNLEKLVQKLNAEVGDVRSPCTSRQQGRPSSIRQSISLMDSHIHKNIEDHQKLLKEMECRHKEAISAKMKEFEEHVSKIKVQLRQKDDELDHLKGRLNECRTAKNQALEENLKIKELYQERNKELEECINDCREKLKVLELERDKFKRDFVQLDEKEMALKESQESEQALKDQLMRLQNEVEANAEIIKRLEDDKRKMELGMKALEEQNEMLKKEIKEHLQDKPKISQMLEDKLEQLQKECDDVKALLQEERERCGGFRDELNELRHSSQLLKVDVRILNREKKELKGKLEEKDNEWKGNGEKISELEKKNGELVLKVGNLEDVVVKGLKDLVEEKEHGCQDVKNILKLVKEQNKELEGEQAKLKEEIDKVNGKLREYEKLQKTVKEERDKGIEEKDEIIRERDTKIREQKGQISVLKEVALRLEQDLVNFEAALEVKLVEWEVAVKSKEETDRENEELKKKLERLERQLEEQREFGVSTERSVEEVKRDKERQVGEILEKLDEAMRRSEELEKEMMELEMDKQELERGREELMKSIEKVNAEKDKMQKDLNMLVKTVVDVKEENDTVKKENDTVKKALEEVILKAEGYKVKWQAALSQIKEMEEMRRMDEVRSTTKIEQQEKLIEHLCSQLEAYEKKKKKHGHAFFPTPSKKGGGGGDREFCTPNKASSRGIDYLGSHTPSTPGGGIIIRKNPTLPTPAKEENILLKQKQRSNTVHHGGRAGQNSPRRVLETEDKYVFDGVQEGYVKVRSENMARAEERFVCIADGHVKLFMSDYKSTERSPLEVFCLNEKTKRYFRIDKLADQQEKACSSPLKKDETAALAIKITFYDDDDEDVTLSGCPQTLFMFPKSLNEKRRWIQAIDKYCSSNLNESGQTTDDDENKENFLVGKREIWEDEELGTSLCVNCVYYLEGSDTYLLGCDDGLYSVKTGSKPVKIEGPQSIHQILVLDSAKLAIFIEGSKRIVTTVYSGLLKSCAEAAECSQPKLETRAVTHTQDCYLLAGKCGDKWENTRVAAASNKGLFLCQMGNQGQELIVKRQFLFKVPITTMLMTGDQSVLVGVDTVWELDTKTFEMEEFLDRTDDAILFMQILNEAHGGYPVALLDVTKSKGLDNSKEPEYLICFQDIGVFVDSFGRRSRRGDISWGHVPVAFAYRHPYLYIFSFSKVEIQKLDERSYTLMVAEDCEGGNGGGGRLRREIITPDRRILPIASKSTPNFVGMGAQGVVLAARETATGIKLLEIHPSS